MRKILNTLAVIVVLGGAFVVGRTVTSSDSNGPAGGGTTQSTVDPTQSSATSSASTTPINGNTGLPEVLTDLTKPADWPALGWLTDSLSRTHNVAAIAKARLGAYAHTAYHDAYREQGIDPIIAGTIGGATEEEALLAGAIVYTRLLGDVAYETTADQWYDSLGTTSRDVVDAVLAAAKTDGYDSADSEAPKFTGELAWQPSTELTTNTWGQGLLPGAGTVKTIALDIERCRVPDASVDSIMKEKANLKTIDNDQELDGFRRRATLQSAGGEPSSDIAFYLGETAPKLMVKFKNHQPLDAEMSTYLKTIVYSYDMLIVAFKAKWSNGIASPFEIAGAGSGLGLAAPSYPSVPSATMAFIQAFLGESRGQVLTYEEIESSTKRVEGIQAYNKTLAERVVHWEADVQAGQALGQCVVKALLES